VGAIDLHIHSIHSDGDLTPREIVLAAHEMQLTALAVTDHDSTDGVAEAVAAGVELGVEVIPGLELSVRHGPYEQVHMLGYFVDVDNPSLGEHLVKLRDSRLGRGKRLVERINQRLKEQGHPFIDFARVESLADKVIGRPHVAKVLVEAGICSDLRKAFRDYLVPLNIQKHKLTLSQAVKAVQNAGGITVLAHPNLITRDRQEEVRLLDEFTRLGLEGIEVYYNNMTPEDTEHYRVLALERNLLLTGGSDFHGYKSYGNLGRVYGDRLVPEELLETLKDAFFRRRTILAVFVLPGQPLGRALGEKLSTLASADFLSGCDVLKRNFPAQAHEPSTVVVGATNRILHLEAENRLLRGRSVVIVSPYLDRAACETLSATARQTGAETVFVRSEEGAIDSTSLVCNEVQGRASLSMGPDPTTLCSFLYFNLSKGFVKE
jgi:predicted metal-dependent phosphoesterase TrpH